MDNLNRTAEDLSSQELPERSKLVLVLGFAASFLTACALSLLVGHFGFQSPRSLWPFASGSIVGDLGQEQLGFEPKVISRAGIYMKAVAGERLNPDAQSDYMVFVWFKLRKIPQPGESLALLGKFDQAESNRPGYAVSLEGAPDGVRPRVYLSTGKEPGTWYSFASTLINRKEWYLLVVSLSQSTFVSSYIGRAGSSDQPDLLGGHRIKGAKLPYSKADLVVGAYGASRFRGQVGPFGVVAKEGLSKKIKDYIVAMQADPAKVPGALSKSAVLLWASPRVDHGLKGVVIAELDSPDNSSVGGGKQAASGTAVSIKRIAPPKKINNAAVSKAAKKVSQMKLNARRNSAKGGR